MKDQIHENIKRDTGRHKGASRLDEKVSGTKTTKNYVVNRSIFRHKDKVLKKALHNKMK